MNNLRTILFAVAAGALVMACGLGGQAAAPVDNVGTIVASTLQALSPVVPAATATAPASQPSAAPGIPVSYKNVSFVLPVGLASDAAPAAVPQAGENEGGPWGAAPGHIEFRLNNYDVPGKAFSVREIRVYPATEYANINAGANITVQRLQGLLADPSAEITRQNAPHVPFFNATAMIAAQTKRISFQNGSGIRIVSQYGQAVLPIANDSTFYQFIGLTSDGKYLIVAILPIQAPVLQAAEYSSSPPPAGGVPFPDMSSGSAQVFEAYFQAVTDKLNSTDSASFQPSLATLDALVQSLNVQP
jgi:hypothetical protein